MKNIEERAKEFALDTHDFDWFKKWSEEMEKKRLILRVSWNGLFGDHKDNCMELQKWLIW